MIDYSYAIAEEALRIFVALPARQRRQLLRFFDGLAQRPFRRGIHQEPGAANRTYELQLVGNLPWSPGGVTKEPGNSVWYESNTSTKAVPIP